MAALDIPDASLSGVLSRYSIIHTVPEDVPAVLAEFRRVLAPGGCALVSFPGTDDASPADGSVRPRRLSPPTAGGPTISVLCCTRPAWRRWAA